MPVVSETRGTLATTITGTTATQGLQETNVWMAAPVEITAITWVLRTGTFEFYIDGVLIKGNIVVATDGDAPNVMAGISPINLDTGMHVFGMKRVAGANGWRHVGAQNVVDGWFHYQRWITGVANQVPAIRVTANVNTDHYTRVVPPTTAAFATSYHANTWTVTADDEDKWAAGISIRTNNSIEDAWEVLVDGVLVGETGGTMPLSWTRDFTWIRFDRLVHLPVGVTKTFTIRKKNYNTFAGTRYLFGTEWGGEGVTYGVWQRSSGSATVVGHELVLVDPLVPRPDKITEVRGPVQATQTTVGDALTLTTQTFFVWIPFEAVFEEIWWYVKANTYTFSINGSSRSPIVTGIDSWVNYLEGIPPVTLSAGFHEFKLNRDTSVQSGWGVITEPESVHSWFHASSWLEHPTVGFGPPIRVKAKVDRSQLIVAKPTSAHVAPVSFNNELFSVSSWPVMYKEETDVLALVAHAPMQQTLNTKLEVLVDGLKVGESKANRRPDTGAPSLIVFDSPVKFLANVPRTIAIQAVGQTTVSRMRVVPLTEDNYLETALAFYGELNESSTTKLIPLHELIVDPEGPSLPPPVVLTGGSASALIVGGISNTH